MTQPAPEDKKKEPLLPWYKWYPRDWLTDQTVRLLDMQGQGIYRHLLDAQWMEGSIPADPDDLAQMCGIDPMFFRKIWEKLADKFEPVWGQDDQLVHPKLAKQREEAILEYEKKVQAAAIAGKASGEARRKASTARKRRRDQRKARTDAQRAVDGPSKSVERLPNEPRTDTDTDTDIPPPTTPPDTAPARGRSKHGGETWLTPFDDEWARTHGGTPFLKKGAKTGGELGRWLKIVKAEIAEQEGMVVQNDQLNEMFKRWRSFLSEAGHFATPAKFAKEHGLHKKGKFVGGHDVRRAKPREPAGREKPKLTPST